MVRIYNTDYRKLKPGQLTWFVRSRNGRITKKPCKFLEIRKDPFGKPEALFYFYKSQEELIVNIQASRKGFYPRNLQYFMAKVTKKEEDEFYIEILTL